MFGGKMSSEVGIAILIGLGIGIGVLALAFVVMRLAKRGKLDKLVKQVPSTAGPEATFDVGELMISPVEAREGERVSISYRVTNVGNTRGVYKVRLRINGAEVSRLDIDLAPEGTELVTFAVVETAAGEYKVEVDGLEGIFVITSAKLSVSAVDINPQRAKEGEHVSITAEVTNSGGTTGTQKLDVKLRDEVLFSREVTVAPRATEKVNVTLTNLKPGIYEVRMGDFRTTFMVEMSDYIEPI
jgi:uncharacterized protein (DUF58 family)